MLLMGCSGVVAQSAGDAASTFEPQGSNYLIGPGDTLAIAVWQEPELSVTVPVRPDGKITTPLVEDIVAVGKTPTQLADEMEQRLSAFLRSRPVVTVIVTNFVGVAAAQVRVVGRGIENGTVPYFEGMTVLDVILAKGGLNEFAAGNRSRIIRQIEGRNTEIQVRLDDLLNKGQIEENVALQPGDVLSVPESRF
jgi:polysaccharide export outer membrane protein